MVKLEKGDPVKYKEKLGIYRGPGLNNELAIVEFEDGTFVVSASRLVYDRDRANEAKG